MRRASATGAGTTKASEEIRSFLSENRLCDSRHEEVYIADYDGLPFDIPGVFNEFASLWDLNLLAAQTADATGISGRTPRTPESHLDYVGKDEM